MPTSLRERTIRLADCGTPRLREHLTASLASPTRTARATMSEGTFWKVVKEIGWGTKTTDYKHIERRLLTLWTPDQAEAARGTFQKLQGRLMNRIDRWADENEVEIGTGDDGFSDLTAHIIGLGKGEYDAVMKNPQLAIDRARAPYGSKDGYKESFSYALPWKADYQNLNVSKYVKWAKEMIVKYEDAAKQVFYRHLRGDIRQMVDLLRVLADDKNWSAFLQSEEQGKALAEKLEKEGKEAYAANQPRNAWFAWDGGNPMFNKWAIWNLYSDVRDYIS